MASLAFLAEAEALSAVVLTCVTVADISSALTDNCESEYDLADSKVDAAELFIDSVTSVLLAFNSIASLFWVIAVATSVLPLPNFKLSAEIIS